MQGKRFGFSLEEIRQLLELYNIDDQQNTQLTRTYELGLERLAAMKAQRDELNNAIEDLTEQLGWVDTALTERGLKAAE